MINSKVLTSVSDKTVSVESSTTASPLRLFQTEMNLQITVDDHVMNNESNAGANQAPPPVPRRRNPNLNPPDLSMREISVRDLEPTGPPDRTYKVVFAGDAAVGKTSFINRLTKGHFVSNLASTLGVDFQVKTIRVDERNIAIQGYGRKSKLFRKMYNTDSDSYFSN